MALDVNWSICGDFKDWKKGFLATFWDLRLKCAYGILSVYILRIINMVCHNIQWFQAAVCLKCLLEHSFLCHEFMEDIMRWVVVASRISTSWDLGSLFTNLEHVVYLDGRWWCKTTKQYCVRCQMMTWAGNYYNKWWVKLVWSVCIVDGNSGTRVRAVEIRANYTT